MGEQAKALAEKLKAFNAEVMDFVEKLTDADRLRIGKEDWTLVATALHIGAGHYPTVQERIRMIVEGEALPLVTMEQIVKMANDSAAEHAECSRGDVLEALRENGDALAAYVAGLEDEDLEKKGYFATAGKDLSARKFIEAAIFMSAGEHLTNMKAAVGA